MPWYVLIYVVSFNVNVKSRIVVVSEHKLLKEMFSETAFSGRPNSLLFDAIKDSDIMHGMQATTSSYNVMGEFIS
jgi:hypothetical protein